jgi:hypothetical protein
MELIIMKFSIFVFIFLLCSTIFSDYVFVDRIIDGNHFVTENNDIIEIYNLKISNKEEAKILAEYFLKNNTVWLTGNNRNDSYERMAKVRLYGNNNYSDIIKKYYYDKNNKVIRDIDTNQIITENSYVKQKSCAIKPKPYEIDEETSKSISQIYNAIKKFNYENTVEYYDLDIEIKRKREEKSNLNQSKNILDYDYSYKLDYTFYYYYYDSDESYKVYIEMIIETN